MEIEVSNRTGMVDPETLAEAVSIYPGGAGGMVVNCPACAFLLTGHFTSDAAVTLAKMHIDPEVRLMHRGRSLARPFDRCAKTSIVVWDGTW